MNLVHTVQPTVSVLTTDYLSNTDADTFGRERVGEDFCLLNSTNESVGPNW